MSEKIKTAVMEIIKAHMDGEDKNTKAVLSDVMESVNELETLEQEPMRDFTKEEAEAYSKALDRMYKPTGLNVFNEPCTDAVSRDMALEKMADYVASGYADSAEDFEEYSKIICQLPPVNPKPCDDAINREAVERISKIVENDAKA